MGIAVVSEDANRAADLCNAVAESYTETQEDGLERQIITRAGPSVWAK